MSLWRLFTTFHGRIPRAAWWLGFALFIVANLGGGYLINPDYFLTDDLPTPIWSDTLWQLVLIVPLTAVTVKRCNDRDWPHWLGYAFALAYAVYLLALQLGASMTDPAAKTLFWSVALFELVLVVDNGFMRGTDGPNRHGADPLAPAA